MTPRLETSRLVLSPYVAGFIQPEHIDWLNDPEVVKYSEQRHKAHSESTQRVYLNSFNADEHIWLIQCLVSDEDKTRFLKDIGTITAYVDVPNQVANMGIMIGDRSMWGKGCGREAWQAVMDWLFTQDVRKVECATMSCNSAMRNLAFKCGMRVEGIRQHHFWFDGAPMDMVSYARMRS